MARQPLTTIGELARAGALELHTGTGGGTGTAPVLTEHDVYSGTGPSGTLAPTADEPVLTAPGDVLVPLVGGAAIARVVDQATAGAVPGRGLALLRPDPAALDPWFLAGFLRGTANNRRASSHASTTTRLDVRRNRSATAPGSGHSPSSRTCCGWRDGSANNSYRASTTACRTAPSPRSEGLCGDRATVARIPSLLAGNAVYPQTRNLFRTARQEQRCTAPAFRRSTAPSPRPGGWWACACCSRCCPS